jgi:serine/threonine protein kinase
MVDEIAIQRELSDCKSILEILRVHETATEVQIIMEYVEGGSLGDLLRNKIALSET